MAYLLIKAVDAVNPDPETDRKGCYKRGMIVEVREDGAPLGTSEVLPLFVRGDLVRKDSAVTAKHELEKEGVSGASGHTHRLGAHYKTRRGGEYVWLESGCLCDLHPEYVKGCPDWQQGLSVVTFEPEGTQFVAQPIPIINGKIMWGNEVIS